MEERENFIESMMNYLEQFNIRVDDPHEKSVQDFMTDCLAACMESIRKEQKSKTDLQESLKYLDLDSKQKSCELEEKTNKILQLESETARLENLINMNNLKFKQEREKLTQERDQAKKEHSKMSSLCNQYAHEIKKRETEYLKLQEQMRKCLGEKDLLYKNSIEIMNSFHKNGLNLSPVNGDEDFIHYLKQGHVNFQKSFKEVFDLHSESIEKVFFVIRKELERFGFQVDWKKLNLNCPQEFKNEVDFRVKNFECCLNKLQKIEEDKDYPKEKVPVLKELLNDYREVFDSGILALLKS
jgi:hypothetical protein